MPCACTRSSEARGPPLLLVHGWYAWRLLMPVMARDFQVVAVDQRGMGLSDKPEDEYVGGAESWGEAAGNGMKPAAEYVLAFCDGGYTTNLPLEDVTDGKAWVVDTYDGAPLHPEHGGTARLLVPHLYFWKSAKWFRGP